MYSFVKTSHNCPNCKTKLTLKQLKKPKTLRFPGVLDAGQCQNCKQELCWEDESKKNKSGILLMAILASTILTISNIASGRGINTISILGGAIGGGIVGLFASVPKLNKKTIA